MSYIIPAILCTTYAQAHRQRLPPGNNPYPGAFINNERDVPPNYYPSQSMAVQSQYNVPVAQYPEYSEVNPPSYNYQQYPAQRPPQYNQDPYFNGLPYYNKVGRQRPYGSPNQANNLRQLQKLILVGPVVNPFDVDYDGSDFEDSQGVSDVQLYFDDLELIDNFANYLRRRTRLDPSSTTLNDAAHQYNALLAVIIALARVVRNSCTDFDQVYDQVYQSTVDTYYTYGLNNADKVTGMIEDYIRKGNSHMPKIKKLKRELCEKDLFCSASVDNKIKESSLLYVKELEALDALAHLAKSYYHYIEEFHQASQKGAVLPYLQHSKDRLKEYVMHVVNSVEHLTDKAVNCS